MDWFLYDWDFHYDRVKNFNAHHSEVRPGLIEIGPYNSYTQDKHLIT